MAKPLDQKEESKMLTNANPKPTNSEDIQSFAPNLSDNKPIENASSEQIVDENDRLWKSPSRKKRK